MAGATDTGVAGVGAVADGVDVDGTVEAGAVAGLKDAAALDHAAESPMAARSLSTAEMASAAVAASMEVAISTAVVVSTVAVVSTVEAGFTAVVVDFTEAVARMAAATGN